MKEIEKEIIEDSLPCWKEVGEYHRCIKKYTECLVTELCEDKHDKLILDNNK